MNADEARVGGALHHAGALPLQATVGGCLA